MVLLLLTAVGVAFYGTVLGWTVREALLQIVLTISTLGGEARPGVWSDPVAAWFNIFYVVAILIIVLWGLSLLIEATVSGELLHYWGTRRMTKAIDELTGHYIICGYGRMGQEIAAQLQRAGESFVVVEHNPGQFANLDASGYLHVRGDAREDEQLLRAGIGRAHGLVAVYSTDEENVYIVLSARELNPKLHIVTRSSHKSGAAKLGRAGADRVFSPYEIGGRRMAQAILRPSVVEFLDTIVHGEQMELVLEEVTVGAGAKFCGRTIGGEASPESDIECLGVHLLGIVTHGGTMVMRDLLQRKLEEGDTLILLGEPESVEYAIKQLTADGRSRRRGQGRGRGILGGA